MDSLNRKEQIAIGRQSLRLNRQPKEWKDYSSSDNEEVDEDEDSNPSRRNAAKTGPIGQLRVRNQQAAYDDPIIHHYEKPRNVIDINSMSRKNNFGRSQNWRENLASADNRSISSGQYSVQRGANEYSTIIKDYGSLFRSANASEKLSANNTKNIPNVQIHANPLPLFGYGQRNDSTSTTTGPMVPLPNNLHPSQLLQSSCSGSGAPPSLVPPSRTHHTSSALAAFATSKLHLNKTCVHRCSWKLSTIILTVVILILLVLLAYLGSMNSLSIQPESSKVPCIVVEELESSPRGNEIGTTVGTPAPSCYSLIPRDRIEFAELKLDSGPFSITLEPYKSWNGWLNQPDAGFLRFNFSLLPFDSRLAFLMRRNDLPSLTAHHMLEVISQEKANKLYKRDAQPMQVDLLRYFEPGAWYLTIINDDEEAVLFTLNAEVARDVPTFCPNNCHNHGNCHFGKCNCFPGYIGPDCKDNVCPVLCSGHGRYLQGSCRCEIGWKGSECEVPVDQCEVTDCNGQGKCVAGNCICDPGFRGDHCSIADCIDPTCSGHGGCIDGRCWCKVGWTGINCSDADARLSQFLPNCSSHGVYDLETRKCVCFHHWTGSNCDIDKCNFDCGQHGTCEGGQCHCDEGWNGQRCEKQLCDSRCSEHGTCTNGTCLCNKRWMGKHCTLDGCPNSCSNHGDCVRQNGERWACKCRPGWGGSDCSSLQETNCADDIDNDKDGLSDCADSECCSQDHCRDSLMCIASPDPLDILLRKQPPAVTASFYQKMKFLIEESSVQSYAHRDEYSESRVSVIRGQVISREGNGFIGIRVSVATDPQFGFTLTRADGWFDILVNGGGAVTLQFQRNPFHPIKRTVFVPWNDIVVMANPIVMSSAPDNGDNSPGDPFNTGVDVIITEKRHNHSLWHCMDHNYEEMKPVLIESQRPGGHVSQGSCRENNQVIAESQILQESLPISGSHLHLVYHSSFSQGYHSTVHVRLTPSIIPSTLRLVHLRIIVEGILFEKTFEADPDIKFVYPWNKRNIYKQKVYGFTNAKIYVGYEYKKCHQVIWTAITTVLRGYDMDISELGSWNLDIHHRYNFHEGILQKGDGSIVYFKQQPRVVSMLMGNGQPRSLVCGQECNGLARDNKVLSPIALTSGADGSVYVGDANLVRRITPEKQVYTVFKHKSSRASLHYFITLNPLDGHLYISCPDRHQIIRVHSLDKIEDPESNYDVIVGNGDSCYPHDILRCGDGKPAPEARLIHPKGMAFGTDGSLYFADGNSIRMVDSNGIIHTIIGDRSHRKQWKPLPCSGTISVNEVKLHWPTQVAISPLEGSLYFIDDHMVLRLTHDRRVVIVAGRPFYCKSTPDKRNRLANGRLNDTGHQHLGSLTSFAFGPTGTLYVAEVTDDRVNRVKVVSQDGQLIHFAGKKLNSQNCQVELCKDPNAQNCSCSVLSTQIIASSEFEDKNVNLATDIKLASITAMTVTSDGVLHVADEGSLQVLSVVPYIPQPNDKLEFQIAFQDVQELYIFNKYGQHTMTKNLKTGRTVYTFLYNVDTSFGKLIAVTDSSSNKVSFLRDSGNVLHTIETTRGQKCTVSVNKQGFLETFVDTDNLTTKFTYDPNGLLTSRSDSDVGRTFYYYDQNGRLVRVIQPSGLVWNYLSSSCYPERHVRRNFTDKN